MISSVVIWQGYSRSDNPLEALKLMDEMRSHNLQPQRVTFNSLILACVRGGDLQRALKLLSAMKVRILLQVASFHLCAGRRPVLSCC